MLDIKTKKRIDDLRDILLGKTPSPQSQVEQITTGLIYKFMYDMDKESIDMGGIASFFVGEYEQYSWDKLFDPKKEGIEKVKLYSTAIEKMYNNPNSPPLFREIFKNSYLPFKDPNILGMFLKEINEFHYLDSEILGDAYEYLISFLGKQGDAGQFRTPRHIIDFIVNIVNPKKDESILDPACGTAGFLISSFKHILRSNTLKKVGDQINALEKKEMSKNLVGYDLDPTFVKISLVNLHLNKLTTPQIYEYDTLTSEIRWNEFFDVILANPPFMTPKGGIKPHSRFNVKSTKAEVLFVDYIIEHLKPHGRAGIIVPEGIIFDQEKTYKILRKKLIEDCLVGVISMPAGIFRPYSGVKTSILILDKQLNKTKEDIFFAKMNNDGFSLGAQRTPIKENDIPSLTSNFDLFKKGVHLKDNCIKKEILLNNKFISLSQSKYQTKTLNLNSDYPFKSMADICQITMGQSPSSEFYNENQEGLEFHQGKTNFGSIFLNHSNIWSKKFNKSAEKGSIIMSVRAPVGPVNITKREIAIGRGLCAINSKDDCNQNFLFYMLRSAEEKLSKSSHGSTFDSINKNQILNLEIPLPSLEIQEKIVSKLNGFQKIIDSCKKIIDNYEVCIEVDQSWDIFELGKICEFAYGKGLKESDRIKGEYDVYGSNGVIGSHTSYLVQHPFIIIGRKGSSGSVHFSKKNGYPIDTTFYISEKELKRPDIDIKYLYYYLLSLGLDKTSSEQTIPGLNRNDAYSKMISLPRIEIQKAIIEKVESERKLVDSNIKLKKIYEEKLKKETDKIWGKTVAIN